MLVVDDDPSAIATITALLEPLDISITPVSKAEEALAICEKLTPDLVLLDVMMPGMDGYEVCKQLRANPVTALVPVVMVTALQDRESRLKGISAGADDLLTKPIDAIEVRTRVKNILRLNRYRSQLEERQRLIETLEGSVQVLRDLLSLTDQEVFGNSQRREQVAEDLGRVLGYEPLWELKFAASVCQLGRVTLPDEMRAHLSAGRVLPPPGPQMVARIPEIGSRLLSHIPMLDGVAQIVLWQNKRFDGTGFPFSGKGGGSIPLGARILRLVLDFLDCESRGLSPEAALTLCQGNEGHYDPRVLEAATALYSNREIDERLISLESLEPGMICRSGIKDTSGRVLVAPGVTVTKALRRRLNNFQASSGISQPFTVSVPTEDQ